MSFTAVNVDDEPAPFGVGFHPYLTLGTAAVDALDLTVPAAALPRPGRPGRDPADAAGRRHAQGLHPRTDDRLDASWTPRSASWRAARTGAPSPCWKHPDTGRSVELWVDEGYRYLMVYTADEVGRTDRRAPRHRDRAHDLPARRLPQRRRPDRAATWRVMAWELGPAQQGGIVSVIVVGGGMAGAACASELASDGIDVTLVDRHDYPQFQPLLYQVASSQLPAEDIARPLADDVPPTARRSPSSPARSPRSTSTRDRHDGCRHPRPRRPSRARRRLAAELLRRPRRAEHAFPLYSVRDAERLRVHLRDRLRELCAPDSAGDADRRHRRRRADRRGDRRRARRAVQRPARTRAARRHGVGAPGRSRERAARPVLRRVHGYALDKLTEMGVEVTFGVAVPRSADTGDAVRRHHPRDRHGDLGRRRVRLARSRAHRRHAGPRRPDRRRPGPVRPRIRRRLRGRRRREHPRPGRAHAPPARLGRPAVRDSGRARTSSR